MDYIKKNYVIREKVDVTNSNLKKLVITVIPVALLNVHSSPTTGFG